LKLIQNIKIKKIPTNTGKIVEPFLEIYQMNKNTGNTNKSDEIMTLIWTSENVTSLFNT
jgi:hypothetical protein